MVDGEKEGQNPFLTEFSIPPPLSSLLAMTGCVNMELGPVKCPRPLEMPGYLRYSHPAGTGSLVVLVELGCSLAHPLI